APALDISEFENAPPTIQRSFRAARFALNGLTLGYHTAARVFRSGKFGEDKIVEYFYRDSPADAALMSDLHLREVTRNNIAYCFGDPSQIARDVAAWGSDWSSDFAAAAEAIPVLFAHGAEHTFLPAARIAALADGRENVSHLIFEGSAQLALYQHARPIADAIARM
ncbi:MAG: hypothetical protein AAFP78_13310, partial [Pseudomonadota bacterium]